MESVDNVAGIDVHKAMLAVVVSRSGQPEEQWLRRKFGTTTQDLESLVAWLQQQQVQEVAMESTAQYWKPVWITLEAHFRLHLAQARSNKAPKGRKSDFRDAVRIVKRLQADDLTLSFVPDAEQRRWRLLTRTHQQFTRDRVRLQNQMEGLLEEGQIKLSSVISDLLGVSGYRILRALAAGESDLEKLADLADPGLRVSRDGLMGALRGSLHPMHRQLLGLFLDRLDLLEEQMELVTKQISQAMDLHQQAIGRLCQVPGLGSEAAHQILAELGPTAAAFASARQVSSWVGVCPGREESAGESKSNRSPKGNRPMRRLLNQCAWAAVKTKDSYFQHLYRRLVARLGVKKSVWAVAHRLLKLVWKILHRGVDYIEHGPLGLNEKARKRRKQRLIRELRSLGYTVAVAAVQA
jgi:transposase